MIPGGNATTLKMKYLGTSSAMPGMCGSLQGSPTCLPGSYLCLAHPRAALGTSRWAVPARCERHLCCDTEPQRFYCRPNGFHATATEFRISRRKLLSVGIACAGRARRLASHGFVSAHSATYLSNARKGTDLTSWLSPKGLDGGVASVRFGRGAAARGSWVTAARVRHAGRCMGTVGSGGGSSDVDVVGRGGVGLQVVARRPFVALRMGKAMILASPSSSSRPAAVCDK
jgi:hypothetical protein